MSSKFALKKTERTLTVFNYLAGSGEYIGSGAAFIPAGTGLPAYATHISPPATPAGMVALFINDVWQTVVDNRGKTAWHKETGQPHIISEPGDLHAGLTFESPRSAFDIWDGMQWVKDEEAERQSIIARNEEQKAALMKEASAQIAILEDAQTLGIATEDELKLLTSWKLYRVKLNRIAMGALPDTELPTASV